MTPSRPRGCLAIAVLAFALLGGCGGSSGGGSHTASRAAGVYATKWEPEFRLDASGRQVLTLSRTGHELRLEVVDQTCHPHDPRFADPSRRLSGVTEQQLPAAVIVTVHMHSEPAVPGCYPVGVGFPITVKLAHPLGARALVDGGTPRIGGGAPIAVIRVPAQSRRLERQAEAQFGKPDVPQVP